VTNDYVVVFHHFSVRSTYRDALADGLDALVAKQSARWEGLVSALVLPSLDGTEVALLSLWRGGADWTSGWAALREDPQFAELIRHSGVGKTVASALSSEQLRAAVQALRRAEPDVLAGP